MLTTVSGLRRAVGRLLVLLACGLAALAALMFAAAAGATTFNRVATLTHKGSALVTGASANGHRVLIVAGQPGSMLFIPPESERPLLLTSPSMRPRKIDRGFDQDSSVSSNGRYIAWVNRNCSYMHSASAFVQSTRPGTAPRQLAIPKRYAQNDITSIVVSPNGRVTVLSLADDPSDAACLTSSANNAILSAAPGSRRFDIVAQAHATVAGSAVSPDGSTFALCGPVVVAVRAAPRLHIASADAPGVAPAAGCAASNRGTATDVRLTSTVSTRLVTVGLGNTARIDITYPELDGGAFAVNPAGTRAVITTDTPGRLAVVDLLDGRARTLPKPGFLAHAPRALFGITAPLTWSNADTIAGVVSMGKSDDGFLVDPKTGDWSPPLPEPAGRLFYCSDRSGRVLWTDGLGAGLPDQRFFVTTPDSLHFTAIDNHLGTISNLSCPAGQGRVFLTTSTTYGPVDVDATPLDAINGSPWTAGR